jgi:hypothetical protein
MKLKENSPDNGKKVLTSIHAAYTLSTTPEGISKSDDLIVKNFLNTLAEVALSVAQRKQRMKDS